MRASFLTSNVILQIELGYKLAVVIERGLPDTSKLLRKSDTIINHVKKEEEKNEKANNKAAKRFLSTLKKKRYQIVC